MTIEVAVGASGGACGLGGHPEAARAGEPDAARASGSATDPNCSPPGTAGAGANGYVRRGLSGILCIGRDLRVRSCVLWAGKDHVCD